MATNPIRIFIDRQARQLAQYKGSILQLPNLGQNDHCDLTLQFGDPTGNIDNTAWSIVNMQPFTLEMLIGLQPKGDGSVAPLSGPTMLTWDPTVNQFWYGQLDLSPAGITTALSTNSSVAMVLQFRVFSNGTPIQTIQLPVTIFAVENPGASGPPAPAADYLTRLQTQANFVPFRIPAGATIIWETSDPKKQMSMSVDDNMEPVFTKLVSP